MKKELTFINLSKIKSKKNGKTYYKVGTFNQEKKILKEDFITEETYNTIQNLDLEFGDPITLLYEINALNKCYVVSAE